MWNRQELAKALNIDENLCFDAENISIDSRNIKKNDIFLAIKGEKFDGHNFLQEVAKKQISCAIVEKINTKIAVSQIKVENCYDALIKLAKYKRENIKKTTKIIAITGSVGKTTFKENLQQILNLKYRCYYSQGNFNNHYGLPLSLVNMPKKIDFAIFELGMNHSKEINFLSEIAKPHLAIITQISEAHLENFKDVSGIIRAKLEIIDGLDKKNGQLVIGNDHFSQEIAQEMAKKGFFGIKTHFFGEKNAKNDLFIKNFTKKANFLEINCVLQQKNSYKLKFKPLNDDLAKSLSAILLIYQILGLNIQEILSEFINLGAIEGRGQVISNFLNKNITLIDDSYNASPVSMQSSLKYLSNFSQTQRKIAILGDMLELGKDSLKKHLQLTKFLTKIDGVIAIGPDMTKLFEILPKQQQISCFAEINQENIEKIKDSLKENDIVLTKASNGMKLFKIKE